MKRLAEIEAHITGVRELLDIVGAMRSLAGMRMQEALGALPGIRRYAEAMASGVANTALLLGDVLPPPPGNTAAPRAVVLCAPEHGFVGGFNERLVAAAEAVLTPSDVFLILGTRGAALAIERGREANWTYPMASRCDAAPDGVERLSSELYRRIARGEVSRVEVIHARHRPGQTPSIERRLLLPLDMAALKVKQPHQPPIHNLDPFLLHERLVAEYVFALLTEAAVESIASENAARLAAMAAAHDNVSKKLESLVSDARYARQSEITTELIDVVTGAEALMGS
jgi:F-type H+-transporting ATPase subunit gamma